MHLLFILSAEFLGKMPIKMLMRDQAVVFRKSSNRCLLHKNSPVDYFYCGQTSIWLEGER
ncbi:hypothetical protein DXZ79_03935 [Yersinia rochesterensis]|uniref:Uncharacterized protein n=1 Tax=Yersinia rochesterensis TaxID=1604335 RepID=A0A8D4SPE5_9GAMM|nr:hypothetical protein DXZ79_03935 [Yersinia rochesterensis]